jgi:predicted DNA-binding transcriptional regulator AlpA
MDESTKLPDSALLVTLSVGQTRELIRQEVSQVSVGIPQVRLLDIYEAAKLLSVSPDWLYRKSKTLPFTRKLGPKMLRFSYDGIIKWLATS